MTNNDDIWREVFVSGLKNAHAVEHQARSEPYSN